ncbi:DUF5703 family protein [Streptosporangium sp. CA-135522]|uniref:DUF5703 family protein n=1 Tax=Streptosporangium sp. CA-135522 TaxID=3240072 RepID=UPI003D8A9F1F
MVFALEGDSTITRRVPPALPFLAGTLLPTSLFALVPRFLPSRVTRSGSGTLQGKPQGRTIKPYECRRPPAHPRRLIAVLDYSYLVLHLPRGTSRDTARQILTEHAEYGDWELDRLRLYPDGRRDVRLRRKIIRVTRTM